MEGGVRTHEVRRSDLNGRSSNEDEFKKILGRADTTNAYDGDSDCVRSLPDTAQGDRLDAGTGKAAHHVGEPRGAAPQIHGHAQEGVDAGHGICALGLDALRDVRDAGDVGRQFDDDVLVGRIAPHGSDHCRGLNRILTEK